ncbi:MAG: hypothetical protein JNL11_14310 [Bdellovibrionaceae bacterium]|nr:hypothetical protein [Pseudobdellovibrionaceae bacterium]
MIKFFTGVFLVTSYAFAQNMPIRPVALHPVVPSQPSQTILPASVRASTLSVAATAPQAAGANQYTVRSYKEWKNEKVQMAIKRVTITRAQIEYRRLNKQFLQKAEHSGAKDIELERLEATLKNDLYSLEVAQELSVTDYFAIYLTKQENKTEAYKEAAEKMTADEVSQLIKAYADSMFVPNGIPAAATKVGPTAMDKSDRLK